MTKELMNPIERRRKPSVTRRVLTFLGLTAVGLFAASQLDVNADKAPAIRIESTCDNSVSPCGTTTEGVPATNEDKDTPTTVEVTTTLPDTSTTEVVDTTSTTTPIVTVPVTVTIPPVTK